MADNSVVGCLEAGEVMELLMMSDLFGSDINEGSGLKSLVNDEERVGGEVDQLNLSD